MSILNDIAKDPAVAKAEIIDITIRKHDGSDRMSIMPQFIELTFGQSIFNSLMRADLLILDPISMHVNYPLVGEEIVEIILKPTTNDITDPLNLDSPKEGNAQSDLRLTMEFMISDVRQMYPDDKARSSVYVLHMYSHTMYHNLKWRVQKAYNDQYQNVAKDILRKYLKVDDDINDNGMLKADRANTATGTPVTEAFRQKIKESNFEESRGPIPIVIPNLKPLEAIQWCAKRAVPVKTEHNLYMFFETFDGFHFETLQQLMKKNMGIGKGGVSTGELNRSSHKFLWVSNINAEIRKQINVKNLDQHMITAMQINKRYSTMEKFISGFYENEWYEIDIANKRVNNTQTSVPDEPKETIEKHSLNTKKYLDDAKIKNENKGTKTRVRYKVGQNGGDDPSTKTYYEEKFGEGVRSQTALSQIHITIAVPGHTSVNAGDMVEIELPEMHGFNHVKEDEYISGKYLVVDIKHTLTVGENHYMTLNLSRDSFATKIADKTKYNLGGF